MQITSCLTFCLADKHLFETIRSLAGIISYFCIIITLFYKYFPESFSFLAIRVCRVCEFMCVGE